jgi:hypothetical protein
MNTMYKRRVPKPVYDMMTIKRTWALQSLSAGSALVPRKSNRFSFVRCIASEATSLCAYIEESIYTFFKCNKYRKWKPFGKWGNYRWQREKQVSYARIAGMILQNGWGNVLDVDSGIRWWKKSPNLRKDIADPFKPEDPVRSPLRSRK